MLFVMPGLVPGIHVFAFLRQERRGWPGQARPWRRVPHFQRRYRKRHISHY